MFIYSCSVVCFLRLFHFLPRVAAVRPLYALNFLLGESDGGNFPDCFRHLLSGKLLLDWTAVSCAHFCDGGVVRLCPRLFVSVFGGVIHFRFREWGCDARADGWS
jgi:hypothetical protein